MSWVSKQQPWRISRVNYSSEYKLDILDISFREKINGDSQNGLYSGEWSGKYFVNIWRCTL